jgi:hypothetical protein
MPDPVTHEFWPEVQYRIFVLQDSRGAHSPLAAGAPALDQLVLAAPGGLVLGSAGNDFQPQVLIQVWPTAPAPSEEDWDQVDEVTFECPSGRARLASIQGTPAGPDVPLGPPGTYHVRVHCRGRTEAAARLGRELFYRGVEIWLLQVWPAR